jgi:hypothetical protein
MRDVLTAFDDTAYLGRLAYPLGGSVDLREILLQFCTKPEETSVKC